MAIRALDYTPPIHITFDDYLAALLTADKAVRPNDAPDEYRRIISQTFGRFGIRSPTKNVDGTWHRQTEGTISYERVHYDQLQNDPNEIFRFVWENRNELHMNPAAYTQIESVRPALRNAADGFVLRETVAEAVQFLRLTTAELEALCETQFAERGVKAVDKKKLGVLEAFDSDFVHELKGGATLIFDDFGHLKYAIGTRVDNGAAQLGRIESLLEHGFYDQPQGVGQRIADIHQRRALEGGGYQGELW